MAHVGETGEHRHGELASVDEVVRRVIYQFATVEHQEGAVRIQLGSREQHGSLHLDLWQAGDLDDALKEVKPSFTRLPEEPVPIVGVNIDGAATMVRDDRSVVSG
jgi:hypothetical protein